MHPLLLLAFALPLTTALPSPSSQFSQLKALNTLTSSSPLCGISSSTPNVSPCTGAPLKDTIISFGTTCTASQRNMLFSAVTGAGSTVIYDWGDFGFSAYIPAPVVPLVKAHADTIPGVKVYDNACFEIPWCGEAPC